MLALWKKSYDKPRKHIRKQRHYFAQKGPSSQSYGFSNSHVWMWQLDHKEGWAPKNWYFWTVVLEKTLESPLDCKEIQPVHPKVLTNSLEGLMLKLKLQYFDHLMQKANSLEETLMLGKIEGRRRRGDREWDSWMASPTQRTGVWANFRSWWWTGKPGVLHSMGSKRVRHNRATELNWFSPKPLSLRLPHNLGQSSMSYNSKSWNKSFTPSDFSFPMRVPFQVVIRRNK